MIWVEKYRPREFKDVVGLKPGIEEIVEKGDIPHFLFVGPPGVGKTTTARIIADKLDSVLLELNSSDERGIDVIRNKVKDFARMKSDKLKIILLDEADGLTSDAQDSLRRLMELYHFNTRFIFTANYVGKIIEPLRSRTTLIEFHPAKPKDILKRLKYILDSEEVEYDEELILSIIDNCYPDIRRMVNVLQFNVKDGKLQDDIQIMDTVSDVIFDLIKSKDLKKIRKVLINYSVDYNVLYKNLFEKFFEMNKPEILILISEYMYRSYFVVDPMINFIGMVLKLFEYL